MAECVNVLKTKTGHGMARIGTRKLALLLLMVDYQENELALTNDVNTGDEVVVVIKKARPVPAGLAGQALAQKVRRGEVRRAVVVRTKFPTRRPDGRTVRFDDNAAVIINHKKEMVGNRIQGVVASDLRLRGWTKILGVAPKIV